MSILSSEVVKVLSSGSSGLGIMQTTDDSASCEDTMSCLRLGADAALPKGMGRKLAIPKLLMCYRMHSIAC